MPVKEDQALRVGVGIVRIGVDDAIGIVGAGGGDCERTRKTRVRKRRMVLFKCLRIDWAGMTGVGLGFVLSPVSESRPGAPSLCWIEMG